MISRCERAYLLLSSIVPVYTTLVSRRNVFPPVSEPRRTIVVPRRWFHGAEPRGMLEETNVSVEFGGERETRSGWREKDGKRRWIEGEKEGKREEEDEGLRGWRRKRRRASFFISFREHGGQRPLWRILLWRINVCTRVRIRREPIWMCASERAARPIANVLIAPSWNPGWPMGDGVAYLYTAGNDRYGFLSFFLFLVYSLYSRINVSG